jgi:hypothetical protein
MVIVYKRLWVIQVRYDALQFSQIAEWLIVLVINLFVFEMWNMEY